MEIKRCEKGHFYDADQCTTCPICASEAAKKPNLDLSPDFFENFGGTSVPATQPVSNVAPIGSTQPAGFSLSFGDSPSAVQSISPTAPAGHAPAPAGKMDPITPTMPAGRAPASSGKMEPITPTMPSGQAPASSGMAPISPTMPAGYSAGFSPAPSAPSAPQKPVSSGRMEPITATTPVSPVNSQASAPASGKGVFDPVVGWLVCIEGADRGADYRIHSQYNYIGRAPHMDICIPSDSYISGERAAVLAFDNLEKMFFFSPGTGHNIVRVNGKVVMNAVQLNAYDRLTVGKTTLLFVPLCGDHFDWNE